MTIKALLVDDETLARNELAYLLSKWEEIQIVGEAENGEEAIEKIIEVEPDVVFLDINMPNMDGLTLARKLMEEKLESLIVFATAFDQHAIKAFEINAIDYLLKPFDEERVKVTVERIKKRLERRKTEHEHISEFLHQFMEKGKEKPAKDISKLAVQSDERVILLDPNEIVYAYREGREVQIKTKKLSYTTKYTLQTLEEKLGRYHFFRTHRSYLVNLNFAQEMIPWFNGAYNLLMKDDEQSKIPVSRQFVKPLRDILEL